MDTRHGDLIGLRLSLRKESGIKCPIINASVTSGAKLVCLEKEYLSTGNKHDPIIQS
jgi:hypothetical protein